MEQLYEATAGDTTDLYYVDTEMYDSREYGSVYILDADRPALVDTGTGYNYETILEGMAEVGIEPEELSVIALTHVHLDHAGGASILAENCPNADVCIHESGARFLRDPTRIWAGTKAVMGERIRYYREPDPIPEDRILELEDGDTIGLGDHTLSVHHAPGHAFHQVVYHDDENDGVVTADAAGLNLPSVDGVTQTSPPTDFHLERCLDDIAMLQELDASALYYGHFGDRETDDLLAEYADVLQSWVGAVEAKREELEDDEAVIEHFVDRAETPDAWNDEHARGETEINVRGVLRYLDERESP